MILVTGATGVVGREVVRQLLEADQEIQVLARDRDRAAVLGTEVKVVVGDLGRPETLAGAVAGADRVFMLAGGGPETPLHDANLAEAALAAGVGHLVKLSIIGAEYGFDDLVRTWHLAGERTIQQISRRPGGPTWTFVRPGEYMSNARLWAPAVKAKGTVFWPHGAVKVAVIDPRDVAAVAVQALITPGHEGKAYRIGGPEALSVTERVERLGAVLGRPIDFVEVSVADARDAAARAGRQPLVVETTLRNLEREEFKAHARTVLPTFQQVVGRAPYTFDQWVTDYAAIFG